MEERRESRIRDPALISNRGETNRGQDVSRMEKVEEPQHIWITVGNLEYQSV